MFPPNVVGQPVPDAFKFKCKEYVAQRGEDRWLEEHWLRQFFKLDGVYVEIGAFEGKKWSNTWWLEKCLNWHGLLIEGDPTNHAKCEQSRGECIHSAVCEEEEGGTVTFVSGGATAGMPDSFPEAFAKKFHPNLGKKQHFEVPCKPFRALLKEHNIGAIDVWSLDVENSEQIVLSTHDWIANPVHLLIIEAARDADEEKVRVRFLESLCMERLILEKAIHSNIWFNHWYPLPACQGKSKVPRLRTVDVGKLFTDIPFPEQ